MIDENITFILFGYTSDTLKPYSRKKVLRVCNYCKDERLIQYTNCTDLCASCSHKGKNHNEEAKRKMSKNHANVSGKNHPQWSGGTKMATARYDAKRKQLFGFIPHNIPQENFHGHHLDFNHVIFIPKELHTSIWHSVVKNMNMDIINDAVCDWYLEYQIHQ